MIVIEDAQFTVKTFVECLIERLRKDGRAVPEDGLEVTENQFTMVVRSPISILLVQGILEKHKGVNRLVIYMCPDLEAVKAVSQLINLGTKALELSGAIVSGPTGMLILAGKFGVAKIMERRKKERELRRFQQVTTEVCEIDLMLEERLIEPVTMGLPKTTEKTWIRWEHTYRALLDIYELRMRKNLSRFFKKPVQLFRDKTFRDGTVDLFGIHRDGDCIKGLIFLVTNRTPSSRPFRATEITRISRQALQYESPILVKDPVVVCIFVSATTPAYEPKVWQLLAQNPYVPGSENSFPLLILLPPERGVWHNIMPPNQPNLAEEILRVPLQALGLLKNNERAVSLPYISSKEYLIKHQELTRFWTRILTPRQVNSLIY
jgi:hypothetical protein